MKAAALFQGRRVSKAITATNNAEPIMDHMIGKLVVPILTGKSSGRPIARAIHRPKIAPTNPSAIETRQPPREKPVIACPSAPQIPATIRRMSRSNNVMRQIITALSCCAQPSLMVYTGQLRTSIPTQHGANLCRVSLSSHNNLRGASPLLPTCAVMPRLIRLSHMRLS